MPSESTEKKAHRILAEGRLTVLRTDSVIAAECKGFSDGSVYNLGYDPGPKQWRCTCKAYRDFGKRCAHLFALQLVTKKPDA